MNANMMGPPMVGEREIATLAQQLAGAADLTLPEAFQVLMVLRVSRLAENVNTAISIFTDTNARNALGVQCSVADGVHAESFVLENMRVGINTCEYLGGLVVG